MSKLNNSWDSVIEQIKINKYNVNKNVSLAEDLYLLINVHYLRFLVNLNYNVKTCFNYIWRNLKIDFEFKNDCVIRY